MLFMVIATTKNAISAHCLLNMQLLKYSFNNIIQFRNLDYMTEGAILTNLGQLNSHDLTLHDELGRLAYASAVA